jgi:hypothetical protein
MNPAPQSAPRRASQFPGLYLFGHQKDNANQYKLSP